MCLYLEPINTTMPVAGTRSSLTIPKNHPDFDSVASVIVKLGAPASC